MKKIKIISCILCLVICVCCGCSSKANQKSTSSQSNTISNNEKIKTITVHKDKNTIKERYDVPEGYERVSTEENSFGEFLRNSKLEKYGEKVKYYDGRTKDKENVYDSVFDVDMAENKSTGQKVFMLAQSYMPAQQTQLLINPNDDSLSPWYSLDFGDTLRTPEWTFSKDQLKRF